MPDQMIVCRGGQALRRGWTTGTCAAAAAGAAAELLLEEPMPVLLDDTFAFYDEKRLESVLKWLSSQKRQVIIFTCHKREQEILDKVSRNSVSIW